MTTVKSGDTAFSVLDAMECGLFGNVGDSLLWLFLIHKNQKSE